MQLSQSPRLQEFFNPTFLNDVLNQAVTSSMHRDDKYTDNLSFRLRFLPKVLRPNGNYKVMHFSYHVCFSHHVWLSHMFASCFFNTTLLDNFKFFWASCSQPALNLFIFVYFYLAPDALDCLELTYRVPWPVNIVITENGIKKYGRVFTFMLQLKQVIWVLNDVWHQLKRDGSLITRWYLCLSSLFKITHNY